MTNIRCEICKEEMLSIRDAYQQVAGWERPGRGISGESGSSLELRGRTGKIAHSSCVVALKNGVAPTQESLV